MGTAGPFRQSMGATRESRHSAMLQRWPVLNESWARQVERSRTAPPSGPVAGPKAGGIDPLTAINRRMGLPDDHGRDAVQQAQAARGRGNA